MYGFSVSGSCGISFRTEFVFNDTEAATSHRNSREKGKILFLSFKIELVVWFCNCVEI